jgi:hypothetical protein
MARLATAVVKAYADNDRRREADVAGLLFYRPNPRAPDSKMGIRDDIPKTINGRPNPEYGYAQLPNLRRDGKLDPRNNYGKFEDPRDESHNEKTGGFDAFMLPDDSRNFYRVPGQSVVNKVGDFCPCGRLTLTAAQWIW